MLSIIINIVLVLSIIGPMAYFIVGRSNNSKGAQTIKSQSQAAGVVPEKIWVWQMGAMAIDKTNKKLFYAPLIGDNKNVTIDLKEIKMSEIIKSYHKEQAHHQSINMLSRAELHLRTHAKTDIIIPLCDVTLCPQPGNDLLDAIDWNKTINEVIK
jgi:uncharacterized protein (UPF0333 family)